MFSGVSSNRLHFAAGLFGSLAVAFLSYAHVLSLMMPVSGRLHYDYHGHVNVAKLMAEDDWRAAHFLWHLFVIALHAVTDNYNLSAYIVTLSCILLTAVIIYIYVCVYMEIRGAKRHWDCWARLPVSLWLLTIYLRRWTGSGLLDILIQIQCIIRQFLALCLLRWCCSCSLTFQEITRHRQSWQSAC